MRFRPTTQLAVPRQSCLDWRYWLLPACLLLITLVQALPAHSAGVQVLAGRNAERVLSADPGLPASQKSLSQLREDVHDGQDADADTPLDFLFILFTPLVPASEFSVAFAGRFCPFLPPVFTRPGAPRGPPAGF